MKDIKNPVGRPIEYSHRISVPLTRRQNVFLEMFAEEEEVSLSEAMRMIFDDYRSRRPDIVDKVNDMVPVNFEETGVKRRSGKKGSGISS